LGHGFRVAHRADCDAIQALGQRLVQNGHVVAGAARHAVVTMIEEQHGTVLGGGVRRSRRHGDGCRQWIGSICEALALFPDLRRDALGHFVRLLAIAIAHHDHADARRRNVGQTKAGQDGYRQHAALFRLPGQCHRPLHGPFVGAAAQGMGYKRRSAPRHDGTHAPGDHLQKQAAGMFAGFVHVDMRIGLEADGNVGMIDQRLRDIAVQIERNRDRRVGQDLAQALEQFSSPSSLFSATIAPCRSSITASQPAAAATIVSVRCV
jgi:hypothetical protein